MTLLVSLQCRSCGAESNARVDRVFPLGLYPCPACGGLRQVLSLFRDRRATEVKVDHDRRSGDGSGGRLADCA
jgi:uncharacterized Zn finger protein